MRTPSVRQRRLVPHRRHRDDRRQRLPAHHRPQEGHVQDVAGKYVAPSAVAATFKGICPYASEIVVYGEGKPYCIALIALDAEAIGEWAAKNGLGGKSFAEIARDEKTESLIAGYVDELNAQLNRWEQVKKFTILDRELTVEAGDMTPSMKLRRKVVVDRFADSISSLYE